MEKNSFDELKEHVCFLVDLLDERQLDKYIAWLDKREENDNDRNS